MGCRSRVPPLSPNTALMSKWSYAGKWSKIRAVDGRKKRKCFVGAGVAVEGCVWRRLENELLAQTLGEHFNGTSLLRGALAREEKNASDPSLRQRCDIPGGSLKSRYWVCAPLCQTMANPLLPDALAGFLSFTCVFFFWPRLFEIHSIFTFSPLLCLDYSYVTLHFLCPCPPLFSSTLSHQTLPSIILRLLICRRLHTPSP